MSKHVPVNFAIHDSLDDEQTCKKNEDLKVLVKRFIKEAESHYRRHGQNVTQELWHPKKKPRCMEQVSKSGSRDWT